MIHFAAREAKNNFGRLLDTARQQPVTIDKQGRPVAVLLSNEEYERLESLEDALLSLRAQQAHNEGFIGLEHSHTILNDILDA